MFTEYHDILNIDELAEALRIGKNATYKLVNSGKINSFKIGGSHKIPREAISDYIIRECKKRTSRLIE